MSAGQFARRSNWYGGNMTPAAVNEDIGKLRLVLGNLDNGTIPWTRMVANGTSTNDSAAAGIVGEYIESVVAAGSAVNSTGTAKYFDVTNIQLTAGDWDITSIVGFTVGTATTITDAIIFSPSTASGDNTTGLVSGSNFFHVLPPTTTVDAEGTVPNFRVSIASTTTYYLKARMSFGGGTAAAFGRISARRIR